MKIWTFESLKWWILWTNVPNSVYLSWQSGLVNINKYNILCDYLIAFHNEEVDLCSIALYFFMMKWISTNAAYYAYTSIRRKNYLKYLQKWILCFTFQIALHSQLLKCSNAYVVHISVQYTSRGFTVLKEYHQTESKCERQTWLQ